jgi:hypothetical protein
LTPDFVVPAFDRIIVGHVKIVETDGKRQLTWALREAVFDIVDPDDARVIVYIGMHYAGALAITNLTYNPRRECG